MENLQGELERLIAKWQGFFGSLPAPYHPFELGRVRLRFNGRMRTRAGLCKPHALTIELNPHLMTGTDVLEEVLLHELCHLAVGLRWPRAESHGEKWARLMGLCGLKARRCHDLPVTLRRPHRRWDLKCSCRVHRVSTLVYNRVRRGVRYRCLDCRAALRPETVGSA